MSASARIDEDTKLPPRKVLLLDIDQNLAEFKRTENSISSLSSSANDSLSKSSELQNIRLGSEEKFGLHGIVFQGNAISKKDWLAVFSMIIDTNKKYLALQNNGKVPNDDEPLVRLEFLTNAQYTEDEFLSVFKNLFPSIPEDDIEFLMPVSGCYNNIESQYSALGLYDDNVKCIPYPSLKSDFMEHRYNSEWNRLVTDKSNVALVDDSNDNCVHAQDKGFTAILHPTNPSTRPANMFYTTEKEPTFNKVHQFLAESSVYCKQFDTNLKLV